MSFIILFFLTAAQSRFANHSSLAKHLRKELPFLHILLLLPYIFMLEKNIGCKLLAVCWGFLSGFLICCFFWVNSIWIIQELIQSFKRPLLGDSCYESNFCHTIPNLSLSDAVEDARYVLEKNDENSESPSRMIKPFMYDG